MDEPVKLLNGITKCNIGALNAPDLINGFSIILAAINFLIILIFFILASHGDSATKSKRYMAIISRARDVIVDDDRRLDRVVINMI